MNWNLLQVSDVLDIEFGSALAERVPTVAWEPEREYFPRLRRGPLRSRENADPPLTIRGFPLLRGYARWPGSVIARIDTSVTDCLLRYTTDPEDSPLICTIPYFAPVAERWPGPVIYWLTDLMEQYTGADPAMVHDLDRRMCRTAKLVCPNSQRLADYLIQHGNCLPEKIRILPNATRASNLLPQPPHAPGKLPPDIARLQRPIVGVIGNLAGNMDWLFLEELICSTPNFSWVFVGPTTMHIPELEIRSARARVLRLPNAHAIGLKPYGDLAAYARCFDIAVLPYRRCEPTYSGSSTRFYEHLAACRPMISTRGFEELLHKEPLLQLVTSAEHANDVLQELQSNGFDDGRADLRWEASRNGTWQVRAAVVQRELEQIRSSARQSASADPLSPTHITAAF
jgi:hypothetical protein